MKRTIEWLQKELEKGNPKAKECLEFGNEYKAEMKENYIKITKK